MTSRILFFETEKMKCDWEGSNYTSQEVIRSLEFNVFDLGYLLDFHIEVLSLEMRLELGREVWVGDPICEAIVILMA